MKRIFIVLILLSVAFSVAQNKYQHGFINSPTETTFNKDYSEYEKVMRQRYDTAFKNKKMLQTYIDRNINGLRSTFESGRVYTNWKYAEDYLNTLLKNLIGKNYTANINVKILQNPEVNAYMTESGQAYVNTGFLAFANSEAEIAAVLGHEYGHYLHMDDYFGFKEELKSEWQRQIAQVAPGGMIFYAISTSHSYGNMRDMERSADKTGLELAKTVGYNLYGALAVEVGLGILEENYKKGDEYSGGLLLFRTHPPSKERIKYTAEAAKQQDTSKANYFLINKELFQKVKKQAIDESINLFLQQDNFEGAIELCYRQLLLNPNDEFYLFFLNEAIRRYLMEFPDKGDKFFITGYYDTDPIEKKNIKLPAAIKSGKYEKLSAGKASKTIFYHYEYLMLTDDSNRLNVNLPPSELVNTDTLEFITYTDAQNYFIAKQEKLNQNSVNWVKSCIAGSNKNVTIKSMEPWLNNYTNISKEIEKCLLPQTSNNFIPFAITGFDYEIDYNHLIKKGVRTDSIEELCINLTKQKLTQNLAFFSFNGVDIKDRSVITNFIANASSFTFPHKYQKPSRQPHYENKFETIDLSTNLLWPEIIPVLNKNGLQQLVVLDINYYDSSDNLYMKFAKADFMNFNIYFFDLKNNRVSHLYESRPFGENKIVNAFEDLPSWLERITKSEK